MMLDWCRHSLGVKNSLGVTSVSYIKKEERDGYVLSSTLVFYYLQFCLIIFSDIF